ncbi:hypothetical protein CRE_13121 [Caenorhabditis remanei]|uniref:Uncharacterized protein n=1 Tax=Caenorhabditis remanei TaxID=31234 RepID=E3NIM2_CAERE|nr:hypothetical protein CRE_13121 [Caenorhabditis remanei]
MLLKLSILLLLLTQSSTSKEKEEHVEEFLNALAAVTTRNDDVLLAFKQLPNQLDHLMKVVVPIGAMRNVNSTLEKSSQEYKVLMDLQNRTKAIFQERNDRGTTEGRPHLSRMWQPNVAVKWNYEEAVTHPLFEMEFWTKKYLDPESFKEDGDIRNYKEACLTSNTAPKKMLKHIIYRLVTSCGAPVTSEEAKLLTDRRAYLTKVHLNLTAGGPFPDPSTYMIEFSSLSQQLLNKTVLNEELSVFHKYFMGHDDAMDVFLHEISHRPSIYLDLYEEHCLLHALIAVSNFNYASTYYAAICADVLHNGGARSIGVYTEGIIEDVNRIVTFALNYINESLVRLFKHFKISTCLCRYEYEIAMFHRDEKYQFYFNSTENTDHCYSKQNETGFDFVIGRISYNATDDTQKREVKDKISRLEKYVQKLDHMIKPAMDDMYAVNGY